MLQRICHTWEIPDGWTSGQPLKHLNHALWEEYPRNTQGLPFWLWDDRDHLPTATQASLATTSTPVDARGVSGAVVAALFDAFTPRAQGMRNLTQRAGSAPTMREDTFVRKLHEHSWVSLIHESRASQYADGSTDTGSHSPAIGSYLYTFRSGGWESAANPRAVTPDAPLQTLTMHVANDPEKGFTLPRWLDVQLNEDDSNKAVTPHFAGELRAIDDKARTVQPNELVMYGTPLQTWITPAGGADDTTVLVQASIEQSTRKDRSVDLCWQTAISHSSGRKYCTTWDIPEGWQPGQLLKPSSYYHYAMRGYRFSNEQGFWDSLVAH